MATADAAKALAESIIGGNITQATHTAEVVVLRFASIYLPLGHGPVTAVTSIALGDDDALTVNGDDGYAPSRFGVSRTHPYMWPAGTKITVTYTTGWAEGSEPTAVTEAIGMLTTWLGTKPEANLSKIEIGDEAAWINSGTEAAQAPPQAARALLAPWVRTDA